MAKPRSTGQEYLALILWSIVPAGFLTVIRLISLGRFAPGNFIRDYIVIQAFVLGLLVTANWVQPRLGFDQRWRWSWPWLLLAGTGVSAWPFYQQGAQTEAAWVMLGLLLVLSLCIERILEYGKPRQWRWGIRILAAVVVGGVVSATTQWESRFSDEEFFPALMAAVMIPWWWLLYSVWDRCRITPQLPNTLYRGLATTSRQIGVGVMIAVGALAAATLLAYQHSFYPAEVPQYPGISTDSPFLCGEGASGQRAYDGEAVLRDLLAAIAANPEKGTPEYGMLALGTGDDAWLSAFHDSVMAEAEQMLYTDAANSTKSIQYLAALRAYYVAQVQQAYPDLFDETELELLGQWFVAVNQRAQKAEWVDWMYGLAFSKWPEGPYENQESGAALLALLEATDLSPPDLSPENRAYLDRTARGWNAWFRNPDDAFVYQPIWITNAFFQSLYRPEIDQHKRELAFEWLLLQMMPDGSTPQYNYPIPRSAAGAAYLGALLLDDPRYVWLAGHSLATDAEHVYARPGAERPVALQGVSPTQGSCLLYGDSGLPTQTGPLAPDKIVFRDGWSPDNAYLLLNLRFAGWHRYKATNTVPIVFQGEQIVSDVLDGTPSRWLPEGRSVFRDKHVPRENLNGLLVENSGFSAVLHQLIGMGSVWAQDPPYYADVIAFEAGNNGGSRTLDRSHTRLSAWRGWQHDRWINFYHDGPIVIIDKAIGPNSRRSALSWHLTRQADQVNGNNLRFIVQTGTNPLEFTFLSLDASRADDAQVTVQERDTGLSSLYYSEQGDGVLDVASVFLPGAWVGADVWVEANGGTRTLVVATDLERIELVLDE